MESNCNVCLKKDVCKFVEKMENFANEMYGMFEYPEWNKLDETIKTSKKNCKFYVEKQ